MWGLEVVKVKPEQIQKIDIEEYIKLNKINAKYKLGNKIRDCRTKLGLTQDDIAEMLRCTRQTIANWEGGKSTPSILETCLLCKVLNTELDELFYIIELT